ncbi:MAG: hypothetical protein ACFFFK_01815 [Candidatus Thorarchaeota archaeon]
MIRKRPYLFLIIVFALALLYRSVPVSAHNPTSVTLEYNSETETLTVIVAHAVPSGSLSSHYIYNIVIEKNSVEVISRDYASGDNTVTGTTDTFSVTATEGDVLSATARCTQSGIKTDQITISSATDTDTTPTNNGGTPIDTTLLIAIVVVALGVVGILVALLRKR